MRKADTRLPQLVRRTQAAGADRGVKPGSICWVLMLIATRNISAMRSTWVLVGCQLT